MEPNTQTFRAEYLEELEVARAQLLALAEAVPEDRFGWRPAEGMRTFSAVLVHIAAVNFGLLWLAGWRGDHGVYDTPGDLKSMVQRNVELEKTVTAKRDAVDLLKRSFQAVLDSYTEAAGERMVDFAGRQTTARRLYMRMLAHSHEHVGQAVAYVRMSGMTVPWPDPLKEFV